jgi:hypothetical protein
VTVTDVDGSGQASIPVFAITVAAAGTSGTAVYDYTQAPSGTHLAGKTLDPVCTIVGTTVTCTSFQLAGVGAADASASLTANFAATVDCWNRGENPNNPVESHQTSFSDSKSSGEVRAKNGRLTVPQLTASPTVGELSGATYCPNTNWKATIRPGTLRVTSYLYTLTMDEYSSPFIRISG